jgi:hypothetical protein
MIQCKKSVFQYASTGLLALLFSSPLQALAGPRVAVGESFSFATQAAADQTAEGARATFREERGLGMVTPLPNQQKVQVTGKSDCGGHECLVIEVEQDMPPFVPQLKDQKHIKKIRALVDPESGDVLDVRTTLLIGASVSNSNQQLFDSDSTLAEFYGAWMNELKDGFEKTFKRDTGEVRSFSVLGREKVAGRDCFVVARRREMPSSQVVEGKLWVDVEKRVVVRVEQAGQKMEMLR